MLDSPPETPPPSYCQAVSRQQVDRERQGQEAGEAGEVASVRLRGWDREQLGLTVTKLSLKRGLIVVRWDGGRNRICFT